jgi:hypothetical protein
MTDQSSSDDMVTVSRQDLREKIARALCDEFLSNCVTAAGRILTFDTANPDSRATWYRQADAVLAVLDAPSGPPEYEQVGMLCAGCGEFTEDHDTPPALGHQNQWSPVYRRVAPSEPEGPPSPTPSLPDPEGQIHA